MSTKLNVNLFIEVLSGTASSSEKEQLKSWLNKSKANRESFEQFKEFWDRSGKAYQSHEFDTAVAQKKMIAKLNRQQRESKLIKVRFRMAIAASITLLIGLAFLTNYLVNPMGDTIRYSTLSNEVKKIILPDSSQVWLNENSSLQISKAFNKRQRKVSLRGEAFFDVQRNEEKTFKVSTGNTVTKVLGTSFNLKIDEEDNVQLIVNSGKVKFYNKLSFRQTELFLAADKGEYIASTRQIAKSKNKDANYNSWKTGVLQFSNTPIDEVCEILSRHYNVQVDLVPDITDLTISGTFRNEELENVLSTITILLNLEVDTNEHGFRLTN